MGPNWPIWSMKLSKTLATHSKLSVYSKMLSVKAESWYFDTQQLSVKL